MTWNQVSVSIIEVRVYAGEAWICFTRLGSRGLYPCHHPCFSDEKVLEARDVALGALCTFPPPPFTVVKWDDKASSFMEAKKTGAPVVTRTKTSKPS